MLKDELSALREENERLARALYPQEVPVLFSNQKSAALAEQHSRIITEHTIGPSNVENNRYFPEAYGLMQLSEIATALQSGSSEQRLLAALQLRQLLVTEEIALKCVGDVQSIFSDSNLTAPVPSSAAEDTPLQPSDKVVNSNLIQPSEAAAEDVPVSPSVASSAAAVSPREPAHEPRRNFTTSIHTLTTPLAANYTSVFVCSRYSEYEPVAGGRPPTPPARPPRGLVMAAQVPLHAQPPPLPPKPAVHAEPVLPPPSRLRFLPAGAPPGARHAQDMLQELLDALDDPVVLCRRVVAECLLCICRVPAALTRLLARDALLRLLPAMARHADAFVRHCFFECVAAAARADATGAPIRLARRRFLEEVVSVSAAEQCPLVLAACLRAVEPVVQLLAGAGAHAEPVAVGAAGDSVLLSRILHVAAHAFTREAELLVAARRQLPPVELHAALQRNGAAQALASAVGRAGGATLRVDASYASGVPHLPHPLYALYCAEELAATAEVVAAEQALLGDPQLPCVPCLAGAGRLLGSLMAPGGALRARALQLGVVSAALALLEGSCDPVLAPAREGALRVLLYASVDAQVKYALLEQDALSVLLRVVARAEQDPGRSARESSAPSLALALQVVASLAEVPQSKQVCDGILTSPATLALLERLTRHARPVVRRTAETALAQVMWEP